MAFAYDWLTSASDARFQASPLDFAFYLEKEEVIELAISVVSAEDEHSLSAHEDSRVRIASCGRGADRIELLPDERAERKCTHFPVVVLVLFQSCVEVNRPVLQHRGVTEAL